MSSKPNSFAVSAILVLLLGLFSIPALAQHREMLLVGKKGDFHISSSFRAGNTLLKPGMYQVQHVLEGADHVIVFREMKMPGPFEKGRTMMDSKLGEEIRVKCKIEPISAKAKDTKLFLRTNTAGEKEVAEVQIKGENVKYIF